MASTKIEWTDDSWNNITGCNQISPGCQNCYAKRMTSRLQAMGQEKYQDGFKVKCHPGNLTDPLNWKKGKMVFVNSMSDTFHDEVPDSFIQAIFKTMRMATQHRFQMLTKRSERLREMSDILPWAENIWMGISVENANYQYRIDHLRETNAYVKFLSIEPLLGPLPDLNLTGIDWVIVGGESGPGARPMKEEWVIDIRNQCIAQNIPFFFKQWGGTNKKKNGRMLEGQFWNQMPVK